MPGRQPYDILRQAALNLDSVAAAYQGEPIAFSPHILGTTGGERRVVAYLFDTGTADPGDDPRGSWRCLAIDELTDIAPILGTWRTPAGWLTNGPPRQLIDQVDVTAKRTDDLDQCSIDEAA